MLVRTSWLIFSSCVLVTGCSVPAPSADLMADLRRMQESEHLYLGYIDERRELLNLIELNGQRHGGTYQVKVPGTDLGKVHADSFHASFFDAEGRSLMSPNGKRVVREQRGDLILEEVGQGTQRTIAGIDRVLGRVHWSPDSELLMYLERASRWDPTALRALDNVVYVTVYRCRDGHKGHLKWFGEGAAAAPWEWLRIPPGLLRNR